jgi:hypothetical protein
MPLAHSGSAHTPAVRRTSVRRRPSGPDESHYLLRVAVVREHQEPVHVLSASRARRDLAPVKDVAGHRAAAHRLVRGGRDAERVGLHGGHSWVRDLDARLESTSPTVPRGRQGRGGKGDQGRSRSAVSLGSWSPTSPPSASTRSAASSSSRRSAGRGGARRRWRCSGWRCSPGSLAGGPTAGPSETLAAAHATGVEPSRIAGAAPLLIHTKDGRVQTEHTYGKDPRSTPG